MNAKAWNAQPNALDEIFFQNDAVSLCLLTNRRAKLMRVVDFRAGPSNAKRAFVMSLAQREGMERVFTLVERDEVATWLKMGFAKEANLPSFYKRSDAFLLGALVEYEDEPPPRSMSRISVAARRERASEPPPSADASIDMAERTTFHAKKLFRDAGLKGTAAPKITLINDADARKAVQVAQRSGKALTGFEVFGRDVERRHYTISARGGLEWTISIEWQACFGNVFLEALTSPRTEAERYAAAAGLTSVCDKLIDEGMVSCFACAPSDDVSLAYIFLASGFRKTGVLRSHIVAGSSRKDAIVWSRKLALPSDD